MAEPEFEVAAAYVAILPSMKGFSAALSETLQKAAADSKSGIGSALQSAAGLFSKGMGEAFRASGGLVSGISRGLVSAATAFGRTLSNVTKTVVGGLSVALGAIATQVIGGGLTRALGINEAESRLKALGYQGREFEAIMSAASNAVDGTSYTLADSVGSAGSLLAAGIKPGAELEAVLKSVGKLADISGRSFADMGSIFAKNAASGIVQMDDLNQLLDAGVPITAYLAKNMGKTVQEIKKLASAGKITFKDFNRAVESIEFDSALYAAQNVSLAWKNVRSQLSKIGANIWKPLVDGMAPVFNNIRAILIAFQKTVDFNPIQVKLAAFMENINGFFDRFKNAAGDIKSSPIIKFTEQLMENFNKLRSAVKGIEGPILGLIFGLVGKMASGIPIIGGLFGSLTGPVGLIIGALIGAGKASSKFRDSIGGLWDSIKGLGTAIAEAFGSDGGSGGVGAMEKFGDILAGVTDFISTAIDGLSTAIMKRAPEIKEAFGTIFTQVSEALEGTSGKEIGDTLVTLFTGLMSAAGVLTTFMINLGQVVGTIVSSGAFESMIGWLSDLAKFVAGNKAAIVGLIGILTIWFVAKKLTKPLLLMGLFFGKGNQLLDRAAKGFDLAGFVKGLSGGFKALVSGSPYIFAGIALIGLMIAEIGGIFYLLDKLGVIDQFKEMASAIGEIVGNFVSSLISALEPAIPVIISWGTQLVTAFYSWMTMLMPVFTFIRDIFLIVFSEIARSVTTVAVAVLDFLPKIVDALSRLTTEVFSGMSNMITTLAKDGVAAGAGGIAAAAGVTAFLAAFGAASVIESLGTNLANLFTSLTEALTGKETTGGLDYISKLGTALREIGEFSTYLSGDQLGAAIDQGLNFGVQLVTSIISGAQSQYPLLSAQLMNQIASMMAQAQSQLNSQPLQIRTQVQQPAISAGGFGTLGGGTSISNSKTYNINSTSNDFARSLLWSGR